MAIKTVKRLLKFQVFPALQSLIFSSNFALTSLLVKINSHTHLFVHSRSHNMTNKLLQIEYMTSRKHEKKMFFLLQLEFYMATPYHIKASKKKRNVMEI